MDWKVTVSADWTCYDEYKSSRLQHVSEAYTYGTICGKYYNAHYAMDVNFDQTSAYASIAGTMSRTLLTGNAEVNIRAKTDQNYPFYKMGAGAQISVKRCD